MTISRLIFYSNYGKIRERNSLNDSKRFCSFMTDWEALHQYQEERQTCWRFSGALCCRRVHRTHVPLRMCKQRVRPQCAGCVCDGDMLRVGALTCPPRVCAIALRPPLVAPHLQHIHEDDEPTPTHLISDVRNRDPIFYSRCQVTSSPPPLPTSTLVAQGDKSYRQLTELQRRVVCRQNAGKDTEAVRV